MFRCIIKKRMVDAKAIFIDAAYIKINVNKEKAGVIYSNEGLRSKAQIRNYCR